MLAVADHQVIWQHTWAGQPHLPTAQLLSTAAGTDDPNQGGTLPVSLPPGLAHHTGCPCIGNLCWGLAVSAGVDFCVILAAGWDFEGSMVAQMATDSIPSSQRGSCVAPATSPRARSGKRSMQIASECPKLKDPHSVYKCVTRMSNVNKCLCNSGGELQDFKDMKSC